MARKMPDFDDMPVTTSSIAVTGAGDGLSDAMRLAPVAMKTGATVYILIEATVQHVDHKRHSADVDTHDRKHSVRAGRSVLMTKAAAKPFLDEGTDKVTELLQKEQVEQGGLQQELD